MWKGFFSKAVVVLVILLNVAFAYRVLEVFAITGTEPMVLIGAWFSFTTGELWMLSGIARTKIHKGEEETKC